jgi:hypothetical protein
MQNAGNNTGKQVKKVSLIETRVNDYGTMTHREIMDGGFNVFGGKPISLP